LKFDDRLLDDLARGLGHQAAHAGQLAHLRRRAARAGMGHHPDGVGGLADLLLQISFIIALATSSVQRDQASTTLL
jgi:hypothetical protein